MACNPLRIYGILEDNSGGLGLVLYVHLPFNPLGHLVIVFSHSISFEDLQRPPEGAVPAVSMDGAFGWPAAGATFIAREEVEQSIEPCVAGGQRSGDLVADGDGLHGFAAAKLSPPQEQEERASHMEG